MSEAVEAYLTGFINGAAIVFSFCAWWSARKIKTTEREIEKRSQNENR